METLLEANKLTRRFGGLVAVDGVSFALGAGQIVGLLGPNGSGKTTVLNLISGALRPDAGTIRLGHVAVERLAPHRIARLGIARTFQLVRTLGSMTCRDNVAAGLAFGRQPVWGTAAETEIDALLDRVGLGGGGKRMPAELTYIDQKRLELARALSLRPVVLLLDEWLAGLNPTELHEGVALIRSLRGEGITILLVEHVMDAIRSLCDRCLVMNAGRLIASGLPSAVLADPEVVRAYLGGGDA